MKFSTAFMGIAATVGLLSSTGAMAAETRSGSALPSSQSVSTAPVHGVRHATSLRNTSNQAEAGSGAYIVAGLAAATIIAGVIVAVSDNDNGADSNG